MIISYSQLVASRYRDQLDEEGRQFLDYTVQGARRIDALLRSLRQYWQVSESGESQRTPVSLSDVLAEEPDVVIVDALLTAAGMSWYEVSNWTRPGGECRHNLGYWHDDDWWGIGPGAHSHRGGERWWNVKHPRTYADRLAAGESPEEDREVLTEDERRMERVMLGLRLAEGLDAMALEPGSAAEVAALVQEGLLDGAAAGSGRLVLTGRGRLLADAVIRRLVS